MLKCPVCGHKKTKVLESRSTENGTAIRRRRQCQACPVRFTTYEREIPPFKIKEMLQTENADTELQESQFKLNPETGQYSYTPPLTGLDLRGEKYKIVMQECATQLKAYFENLENERSKITRKEIIEISMLIGIPVKTTVQFLEYLGKLPITTWERKFEGLSIKKLKSEYNL